MAEPRIVDELDFTNPALREREWRDSTGVQYRWMSDVWHEWSDAGCGEWRPYGLTVHLNGPFTPVDRDDEIGDSDDRGCLIEL